ncbi:uncharacterized protein N7483_002290 [Penicillium malachiteum]|uniref:uncharacterized protein n=1 Tax=Penicillium malachiteum TaxID=1324776 RepID=UPI002548E177|nr:uncharacterized protein N7483_002290 [Penicillium malachiteum]KAJ5737165.1 hypothetical protein N7483_002290 [Penicillium malachiteum]
MVEPRGSAPARLEGNLVKPRAAEDPQDHLTKLRLETPKIARPSRSWTRTRQTAMRALYPSIARSRYNMNMQRGDGAHIAA